MPVSEPSFTARGEQSRDWLGLLLGLATGMVGGAIQGKILATPITHSIVLGGIFGLAFSFWFAKRATTPGAGLIWGLGVALLLWFAKPAIDILLLYSASSDAMLSDLATMLYQLADRGNVRRNQLGLRAEFGF